MIYQTCTVVEINAGETLTLENDINSSGGVKFTLTVPLVAKGLRIYRSTTPDNEKFVKEIIFPDMVRRSPHICKTISFTDTGFAPNNSIDYPTETDLTIPAQNAVHIPDPIMEDAPGNLSPGTYYYRLSYITEETFGPQFIPEPSIEIRYYHPALTEALVMSKEEMFYAPQVDPFNYVSNIADTLITRSITIDSKPYLEQQLFWKGAFHKKIVADLTPVMINTDSDTYLAGMPVFISLSPDDITVEVLENELKGTPIKMRGTEVRYYNTEQNVSYFPSDAAKLLYNINGGNFRILS